LAINQESSFLYESTQITIRLQACFILLVYNLMEEITFFIDFSIFFSVFRVDVGKQLIES